MEIKVRAISKRDIELGTPLMFYTKLIDGEPYFVHEDIRYPYSGVMFDDDFIKMLWTGLKDKNGKEIWEGDIIRYQHYECYPDNEDVLDIVVVKWKNAGFYPFSYLNKQANIEVVGNIYEV